MNEVDEQVKANVEYLNSFQLDETPPFQVPRRPITRRPRAE
jgi:hypothetical protein